MSDITPEQELANTIERFVGERFEDRDYRSGGRRVRVTGFSQARQKFVVRTLVAGQPVGLVSFIGAKTFIEGKHFRKVSH